MSDWPSETRARGSSSVRDDAATSEKGAIARWWCEVRVTRKNAGVEEITNAGKETASNDGGRPGRVVSERNVVRVIPRW